jgi:hypothetical protein
MKMDNEIEELLIQERKKIAYRLCGNGYFLPLDEIAAATKLSLGEVEKIQKQREDDYERRKKINPLYDSRRMEPDESDARVRLKSIWTEHHERGAIQMMKENLEALREMIEDETDENKKKRFEEHRAKVEKNLKDRQKNLEDWNNAF